MHPIRKLLYHMAAGGFMSAGLSCFVLTSKELEEPRFTYYIAGWGFIFLYTLVAVHRYHR